MHTPFTALGQTRLSARAVHSRGSGEIGGLVPDWNGNYFRKRKGAAESEGDEPWAGPGMARNGEWKPALSQAVALKMKGCYRAEGRGGRCRYSNRRNGAVAPGSFRVHRCQRRKRLPSSCPPQYIFPSRPVRAPCDGNAGTTRSGLLFPPVARAEACPGKSAA